MGTDIHPVVQRRSDQNTPWEFVDIPVQDEYGNILDERNYDAFAILANVRNGYGFAGIRTGSGFVPISDQRGLPKDFPNLVHDDYVPVRSSAENSKSFEDNSDIFWLGDHSRTWVTLRELQDYDWDAVVIKRGVLTQQEYIAWMNTPSFLSAMPSFYSAALSGSNILTVPEDRFQSLLNDDALDPSIVYAVSFKRSVKIRDVVPSLVDVAIPWLASLGSPDNVRIVMGFYSLEDANRVL